MSHPPHQHMSPPSNMGSSCPNSPPDAQESLMQHITEGTRAQIEFYFSLYNLQRDDYLRNVLAGDPNPGMVHVNVIAHFPKIIEWQRYFISCFQGASSPVDLVRRAMKDSPTVGMTPDGHWLFPDTWPAVARHLVSPSPTLQSSPSGSQHSRTHSSVSPTPITAPPHSAQTMVPALHHGGHMHQPQPQQPSPSPPRNQPPPQQQPHQQQWYHPPSYHHHQQQQPQASYYPPPLMGTYAGLMAQPYMPTFDYYPPYFYATDTVAEIVDGMDNGMHIHEPQASLDYNHDNDDDDDDEKVVVDAESVHSTQHHKDEKDWMLPPSAVETHSLGDSRVENSGDGGGTTKQRKQGHSKYHKNQGGNYRPHYGENQYSENHPAQPSNYHVNHPKKNHYPHHKRQGNGKGYFRKNNNHHNYRHHQNKNHDHPNPPSPSRGNHPDEPVPPDLQDANFPPLPTVGPPNDSHVVEKDSHTTRSTEGKMTTTTDKPDKPNETQTTRPTTPQGSWSGGTGRSKKKYGGKWKKKAATHSGEHAETDNFSQKKTTS